MRRVWRISAGCLLALAAASVAARADHTRFWRTSDYTEFESGTAKGVALWSDGKLVPAAAFGHFADPNVAYLWTLRTDPQGRLYASGGSNARVFRLDAQGHATTVFQSSELAAQAIAFDAQGDLYVGTSPDGKVYKVTPGGQSSVFFNPKTKYIWSLVVAKDGTVYVGTGDKGEIYAVTPGGKSALFYKSDERHIRALALDAQGDLIAGTDPSGLVIRIAIHRAGAGAPPTAGRAFVLYQTAGQEVTALLPDTHGNIYVASIGAASAQEHAALSAPSPATFVFSALPAGAAAAGSAAAEAEAAQRAATAAAAPAPFTPFPGAAGGSHVYRIAPDGSPQLLWHSPTALVYSLGFTPAGKLLLGTGNNGDVIELEGDGIFSKVADTSAGQVTGFAAGQAGRVYLCTANPGKIFTLGPGIAPEGTFTSAPFDSRIFSRWGRLNWWGRGAADGRVSFYARSGNTSNPDSLWSRWYGPYTMPQAQTIGAPPARFVQWKAVFHPAAGAAPTLSWVSLAYLPKNVAPQIDDVVMQDPGIRVRSVVLPQGVEAVTPVRLRMPRPGGAGPGRGVSPQGEPETPFTFTPPPQGFRSKGWQSVVWSAQDPDGDTLDYSVYYRGEGEQNWKLLKAGLRVPYFSWDTTTMPDGAYYLKIEASDAPSNPPGQALSASREGPRFVVDNTSPVVQDVRAQTATDDAIIQFSAHDPSQTPLARAEYSLDAGPWTPVRPVGELSDAPVEAYRIQLKGLAPGEHTISVRVSDLYDNSGIAKTTFPVAAAPRAKH